MKYFIGGEIESDIYDRFRIQRNKILDFLYEKTLQRSF